MHLRTHRRNEKGVIGVGLTVAFVVTSALSFASCPSGSVYIGRSGQNLTLQNANYSFRGYNMPWIAPSCGGASDSWMDTSFPDIVSHSHANIVRALVADTGSFTAFDRYIAKAKQYGLRIVPALTDNWGQCGDGGSEKYLPWYQSGYKSSYRAYAVAFANRYKNEPAVAWYQLVNEPDARSSGGSCDEVAAKTALRNFADDVTGAIKAVDANHLVDLGAISWCGGQGADYGYVTNGKVDLCDLHHDYGSPTDSYPSAEASEVNQCVGTNHKPGYVGEAGIDIGVGLSARGTDFKNKMSASFSHGLSGYLVWVLVHGCSGSSDHFSIGASQSTSACTGAVDPTETAMASFG